MGLVRILAHIRETFREPKSKRKHQNRRGEKLRRKQVKLLKFILLIRTGKFARSFFINEKKSSRASD